MKSVKEEILRAFRVNWNLIKESAWPKREQYVNVSGTSVMASCIFAIAVLWSRFVLKEIIRPEDGDWSYIVSTILVVVATVVGLSITCTNYWFASNAPDEVLDEREAAQKNQVYVKCFKYLISAVAIGWIAIEVVPKFTGWTPDTDMIQHYLGVVMISAVFLPPLLFARLERKIGLLEDEEDKNEAQP